MEDVGGRVSVDEGRCGCLVSLLLVFTVFTLLSGCFFLGFLKPTIHSKALLNFHYILRRLACQRESKNVYIVRNLRTSFWTSLDDIIFIVMLLFDNMVTGWLSWWLHSSITNHKPQKINLSDLSPGSFKEYDAVI